MPLQMASGKLFRSDPALTNELRGILYTNLDLLGPLETNAGRLVPTDNLGARALIYEFTSVALIFGKVLLSSLFSINYEQSRVL